MENYEKMTRETADIIAENIEFAKVEQRAHVAGSLDEMRNISREEAEEKAVYSFTLVNGKYNGYFVRTSPLYNFCLYVFDGETGRLMYDDTAIVYRGDKTTAEKAMLMYNRACNSFFDIADITAKPRNTYEEFRRAYEFVTQIYPKRYETVPCFYIGKPSDKQEEMMHRGYMCMSALCYFYDKDEADEVEKAEQTVFHLHIEQAKEDIEYYAGALVYEFFNHEAQISGDYEEAAAVVGFEVNELSDKQRLAYKRALKVFNAQCMYGDGEE